MEHENEIKMPENETNISKRESFMKLFGKRFPDISAEDEEAFYGKLNDEFDRIDRSDKAQQELGELLVKDPRSAGFLMVLRKGGNPMEFLIEQYGDDFREALEDEEKAKELSVAFSKYAEKQAKNKELQEKAESNMQKMLDDLDSAQKGGNFTDEDATKAYEYLYGEGGLLDRIITNEISTDDWTMLMKAANYDAMQADAKAKIEEAKIEGEITGRNANIDEKKKRRSKVESMPSAISPNGKEKPSSEPENGMLKFLDNRKKSVWD